MVKPKGDKQVEYLDLDLDPGKSTPPRKVRQHWCLGLGFSFVLFCFFIVRIVHDYLQCFSPTQSKSTVSINKNLHLFYLAISRCASVGP